MMLENEKTTYSGLNFEIPKLEFTCETKLIDIIKQIHEDFDPKVNEVLLKIGKKRYAQLCMK